MYKRKPDGKVYVLMTSGMVVEVYQDLKEATIVINSLRQCWPDSEFRIEPADFYGWED